MEAFQHINFIGKCFNPSDLTDLDRDVLDYVIQKIVWFEQRGRKVCLRGEFICYLMKHARFYENVTLIIEGPVIPECFSLDSEMLKLFSRYEVTKKFKGKRIYLHYSFMQKMYSHLELLAIHSLYTEWQLCDHFLLYKSPNCSKLFFIENFNYNRSRVFFDIIENGGDKKHMIKGNTTIFQPSSLQFLCLNVLSRL